MARRPDLSAAEREMLRGWRDPVETFFESRVKDGTGIVLLNLGGCADQPGAGSVAGFRVLST